MRAAELGEFLRSRRARVDPVSAGFPADRRRTPGLRREELAALSGVTSSWLTKLEQGHARAVSVEVLDALARSLHLTEPERSHLHALAGYRVEGQPVTDAVVTPAMRRLLDELEPNPAYVLDRGWRIVAWNAAEEWLFPGLGTSGERPNLLELVFLDAELAGLMADHEEEQARLVSQFRLHCSDWPDDATVEATVSTLSARSPRFVQLWDANDVSPFATNRRMFDHPSGGRLEFDHHRLAVLDQPGMQLVVYTTIA